MRATLVETRKGEKIKIFKKIRRQGYRRTRGHRQTESVLRVTGISGAGAEAKWDGEVKLVTKAELNARSRNLPFTAPVAAAPAVVAEAAPAAPKKAPKAAAAPAEAAEAPAVTEAAAEAAPKKRAPAKKKTDNAEGGAE